MNGSRASTDGLVDVRRRRGLENARLLLHLGRQHVSSERERHAPQQFGFNVERWIKRPRAADRRRPSSALIGREPRNGVQAAAVLCERRILCDRCRTTGGLLADFGNTKSAQSDALNSPPCAVFVDENRNLIHLLGKILPAALPSLRRILLRKIIVLSLPRPRKGPGGAQRQFLM